MYQQDEKAEFNDAFGYLNRINKGFWMANMAKYERNPIDWLNALIIIYDELSTAIKDKDIELYNKLILDINARCVREYNKETGSFSAGLFAQLHSFEIALRKVYKESGLQMKFQDSASKALR